MPTPTRLFDLFGDLSAIWPSQVVRPNAGVSNANPSLAAWVADLNDCVEVNAVRTGALPGASRNRASVEAQLAVTPGLLGYVDGFPFAFASLGNVEFKVQAITDPNNLVRLFASVTDTGTDVVLEGVPVEIILPGGLLQPPGDQNGGPAVADVSVGDFTPGRLDDLRVVYRQDLGSSVFVHVRIRITADGAVSVRSAVPIDFGACKFSGLPCLAVHDFNLVPSPTLAPDEIEWLRHDVTPWVSTTFDGQFTARSFHFDPSREPFKSAAETFNKQSSKDPAAEFVLDDLVVPFFSAYLLPVPRHLTIGMRRAVTEWQDPKQVFDFDNAPVRIEFAGDPKWGLLIEKLFFRSEPATDTLTFLSGIQLSVQLFRETESSEQAFGIELGENVTPRLVYRRGFLTGLPAPATNADGSPDAIVHVQIGPVSIDLMGIHVGYSLGRALGEKKGFKDCFELLADLFVSVPPAGETSDPVNLRGLSGENVAFAMQGIGWMQGSMHLDGIAFPDGVVATFGPVKLILREISVIAESGASYLSFSAGVAFPLPSGFSGAVEVRRMRFRLPGHPSAPFFKMDGFFLSLKSSTLEIEFGGFFTQEDTTAYRRKEMGLTGTVKLPIAGINYTFGGDFLLGRITSLTGSTAPADNFSYVMLMMFFRAQIPISIGELRGAQVLVAVNMLPALGSGDRSAGELRYYIWYQRSNPLYVSGDRRLSAWNPYQGSFTGGIGVMASITGCGSIVEFSLFVMAVISDDERGILIALEIRLFSNPEPVGWGVLEWDGKNGTFSLLLGVELGLDKFLENPPDWIKNVARLCGTFFIGNKPGTVALGRVADMNTWLSLLIDKDLWGFGLHVQFGVCFEWTEGVVLGGGFVMRMRGGIGGVIALTFNFGFGVVLAFFATGSTDWALVVWIEAGIRFTLFGFFRLGVSARAELRIVGRKPTHGSLSLEVTLETPWWLPDVTYTLAHSWGELMPASLSTSVQALRLAGGSEPSTSRSQALHHERFDNSWNGTGTPRNYSIVDLRAAPASEADRISRFEADTTAAPLATDATISIEMSVVVNDMLALDANMASGGGNQQSGNLDLTYDFIGIAVRRRPRFGVNRVWTSVDERLELPPSFSTSTGVNLSGSFGPQALTKLWDISSRVAEQPVPKKLLLNALTPFEFATRDPAADEELVRQNPTWPCCRPTDKGQAQYRTHEIVFGQDPLGLELSSPKLFTDSQSRLQFLAPAFVRTQRLSISFPPDERVGVVSGRWPGTVFRATLDEDASYCFVRLAWQRSIRFRLSFLAFDDAGTLVGSKLQQLTANSDFVTLSLAGNGPIRRFEVRLIDQAWISGVAENMASSYGSTASEPIIEIDRLSYVSLRDVLDSLVQHEACGATGGSTSPFAGQGKVFFLPHHEYEVALTNRLSIKHPSTVQESANVTEWVYFRTKGLPGLNAVKRVGEELEPHVDRAYTGGRGVLYRKEPVSLAFTEGLQVAVPLASRSPGSSTESFTLMEMQLLVRPEIATEPGTIYTATDHDWIVTHRVGTSNGVVSRPWRSELSLGTTMARRAISLDPYRERLARLTQRPQVTCEVPDPRDVSSAVLLAPPQGSTDPDDPSIALWPERSRYTAIVRQKGAPFVDRRPFEIDDTDAFDWHRDSGGTPPPWTLDSGALHAPAGNDRLLAVFGDASWNHVLVQTSIVLTGTAAGVGVSLPGSGEPTQGIFAVVETAGAGRRLALYRRSTGTQMQLMVEQDLPASTPTDALILQVYAFDDVLRAQIGDVIVETDRDTLREGRVCLMAQGDARFTSLAVEGLDMYLFSFATSRFRSFPEHIGTFSGAIDELAPEMLGVGTSPSAPAAIFSRSEIVTAMKPETLPEERQAVFEKWIQGAGVPIKADVQKLELSSYRVGNQSWFLLLESPEALDFTEEITCALTRRTWVSSSPTRPSRPFEALGPRIDRQRPSSAPSAAVRASRDALRAGVLARESAAGSAFVAGAKTEPILVIHDAVKSGPGLRITVEATEAARPAGRLIFAETGEDSASTRYFIASHGKLAAGAPVVLDALPMQPPPDWTPPPKPVIPEGIKPGAIWGVTLDLVPVTPVFPTGNYVWQPVGLLPLQDATGRRALLFPLAGDGIAALASASYRLELTLSRLRWHTTSVADTTNHYNDSATMTFQL
jgi:hypothetical protein